ncbi:Eco57I restriction-modification methylase domain-containing protein [Nocardia cyriacigeorgica]|uniref:Eco57I restriction-modification methylase domain-containing protein n=1 Tax=Nocardia cyriacigeorgica TaxID=135487 RepID=UPI003CC7C939
MVRRNLSAACQSLGPWFDPAHGSGVFLRAVLSATFAHKEVRDCLYGVDLDPMAAETTSFVLTSEDLRLHEDLAIAPWQRWHGFRRNLATGDALLIDTAHIHDPPTPDSVDRPSLSQPLGKRDPWRLESVFPEIAGKGFNRVIANPPYASLQPAPSVFHIPMLHPVTGGAVAADISPVFVEIATSVLTDTGACTVVTPLSEITSTRSPFPELRQYLRSLPGSVEFMAFDRVPDALFGDDIKTRNAIIHVDKSGMSEVTVSPLYRWTSRTRSVAFASVPTVSVTSVPGVPVTLPKLGTEWERGLYLACNRHRRRIDSWIAKRKSLPLDQIERSAIDAPSDVIAVAPTAYNFLGVTRDPYRAVTDGHDSQNPLSILGFKSEAQASAAYAVLCSRLAFWLWHVTGDGFHVTTALTKLSPVPEAAGAVFENLVELGDRLWKEALQRPVVSMNRGRTTVSYPTSEYDDLLDDIDEQMLGLVGASAETSLRGWHEALVVVDADSDRRNIIRRKSCDASCNP